MPYADRAKARSLFFDALLDAKVREFNPRYAEAEGALLGQFRHLHTDIYGNPPSPEGYGGESIEDFLDGFPSVKREQVIAVIEAGKLRMLETV